MVAFVDWLVHRDAAYFLRLLETATFFNPQSYNPVFEIELAKLLPRLHDPDARHQAMALRHFDWGHYLSRSLLRSGFRDDDQQEAFHAIVVKLLVQPGRLFSGWNPKQHGSLDRRFKRSVWNAIRNFAEKNRNLRRRLTPTDPTVMAGKFAARQPYGDLIDRFRQLVSERLGRLALAILDQRLAGKDAKELVKNAALGNPSNYAVKREVQAVKELAKQFAIASGDQSFLNNLTRAMEGEATTIEKRKAALAARHAVAISSEATTLILAARHKKNDKKSKAIIRTAIRCSGAS
jgi:hypothetical protein